MLISVFIVSVILIFVTYNMVREAQVSSVNSSAFRIQQVMEGARSCAMASGIDSKVRFEANTVLVTCMETNYKLKFEDEQITNNFPGSVAIFNENGVVSQGATINVCNQRQCKTLTIGVGRSDVQIK